MYIRYALKKKTHQRLFFSTPTTPPSSLFFWAGGVGVPRGVLTGSYPPPKTPPMLCENREISDIIYYSITFFSSLKKNCCGLQAVRLFLLASGKATQKTRRNVESMAFKSTESKG